MKTLLNKTLILFICSLAFWSCEKEEDRVIAKTGTAPTLMASQSTLELKEGDKAKDAITFTWTKANFGYDAGIRYTLQFDKKGNNFSKAKSVSVNNSMLKTYTVADINNMANDIGLPGFTPSEMEVRVRAEVSEFYEPTFSNVVTILTTTYLAEPEYPTLYMVGNATEFGWDNTRATAMFRDEADPFVYTYTGRLNAGALKFLGYLGKWAPQFGNNGSNRLQARLKESEPDPGTFNVSAAGYYTVRVSLRDNSFSLTPYDASGKTTYNAIGMIGGFNGWSSDVMMTKSAFNPHFWSGTHTFSADTEMKFRANSDWGVNWGAETKGTEKVRFYGKGTQNGPNITVKAGTYKVFFNDLTGNFVFVKQ